MRETRTSLVTFCAGALILVAAQSVVVRAQDKNKEGQKPATTVDAWRQALPPEAETETLAEGAAASTTQPRPSREEIEQGLLSLELKWMEALRLRDASVLSQLLADDFTFADTRLPGVQRDKGKYLDHALRDLRLVSYEFDKPTVRFYGRTAVVSGRFKQSANVGGADWSGSHLVTDVWVYREGFWRVVSRHMSLLPEAK